MARSPTNLVQAGMFSSLLRPLIVSSSVLLACTADSGSRENERNERERERDAAEPMPDVDAVLPPCEWTLDACPEHINWRFDTLLQAGELDEDAHFVAIGGQVVGVSSGPSASKSVVRLHMDDEIERYGGKFRRYTLPDPVSRLVDVVDGSARPSEPATVYALACQRPKTKCSLWRISADEPDGSALEEIAGSAFDGDATELVFDDDQQQPCVLDQGLHCFDGAWRQDIEPSGDDNPLRGVAMGNSMSIAVAGKGEYWTRAVVPPGQPAMPWTRESVDADVAWTGASDILRGYFLIGERGAFLQSLRDGSTLCSHTSDFAATSGSVLVTKQGDVLFGLNEGRCQLQNLGEDAIVGSTTVYCRASQNLLLMTENRVAGTTHCVRL